MFKTIFLILLFFTPQKNFGQILDQKREIDSICSIIDKPDSIYKRVLMKVALRPSSDGYDYNRYIIDTANNHFLLVIAWREGSNLGRYYYFLNRKLMKVIYKQKKKKLYTTKAILYFKNQKLIYKDDKYKLTKIKSKTLIESNCFLDFVETIDVKEN
ncbi:hypothetical protein BH11BAC3_BH11BAC3_20820 [soil metagenome]